MQHCPNHSSDPSTIQWPKNWSSVHSISIERQWHTTGKEEKNLEKTPNWWLAKTVSQKSLTVVVQVHSSSSSPLASCHQQFLIGHLDNRSIISRNFSDVRCRHEAGKETDRSDRCWNRSCIWYYLKVRRRPCMFHAGNFSSATNKKKETAVLLFLFSLTRDKSTKRVDLLNALSSLHLPTTHNPDHIKRITNSLESRNLHWQESGAFGYKSCPINVNNNKRKTVLHPQIE